MAFLTTMVNTYGGQWFDMSWKPQLDTKPWHDAITAYVDLLKKYGPPGSSAQQLQRDPRALQRRQVRHVDRRDDRRLVHHRPEAEQGRRQGRLRAGAVRRSRRRARTGCGPGRWRFPPARRTPTRRRSSSTGRRRRTTSSWSRRKKGWARVPTGTRKSTYANPEFLKAAKFAEAEKKAIDTREPERQHPAEEPVRRRAVRGDPGVPGDRHRGRPADELGARGQGDGRRRR